MIELVGDDVSPEEIQESNLLIARVFEDIFRTLLGPTGASKLITKDMTEDDVRELVSSKGLSIARELAYDHPTADILINAGRTQGKEVGDGVTSVFILTGELVRLGFELKKLGVHQNTIIKGYQIAADEAIQFIRRIAKQKPDNHDILNVARSAFKSERGKDIAGAVVEALVHIRDEESGEIDVDDVTIIVESGGRESETEFFDGVIIDRSVLDDAMPHDLKDARLLLLNFPVEKRMPNIKDLKDFDLSITPASPSDIKRFRDAEQETLDRIFRKIADTGANVLLCQQAVDDAILNDLSAAGIMTLKRVKNTDMKRLSKVTGAKIVDKIEDLSPEVLGKARRVYEKDVGNERMVFVDAPVKAAASIIVRGATSHVIEGVVSEVKNSLHATKLVLEGAPILPGGGAVEIELAEHLRTFARLYPSREQLAISAFADAIEAIPAALAENCGMDPLDTLLHLRAAHAEGRTTCGISAMHHELRDMIEEGILDPLDIKQTMIRIATGTASAILNIDDLIIAKREVDTRLDIEKRAPEHTYKGGRIKYG
ncbi:hypothetical protein DRN98_00685 [Methanosarcinales archaeon]|nr:MAG: hypothetical protein DRN98_00685 [Methanosarcinales archaeon]